MNSVTFDNGWMNRNLGRIVALTPHCPWKNYHGYKFGELWSSNPWKIGTAFAWVVTAGMLIIRCVLALKVIR